MKIRALTGDDVRKYEEDISMCYTDNIQIMDSQSKLDIFNRDVLLDYVLSILESYESTIEGIFDDDEKFLYGLIIYDGIRMTDDGNAAQLHLAVCKDIWGKYIFKICKERLQCTIYNVLYCMIPSYCRPTIGLVKRLGFKKTGYIPKSIPYRNLKGVEKMYDELIYVWEKPQQNDKV